MCKRLVVLFILLTSLSALAQDSGARQYQVVLPDEATAADTPRPESIIEAVGTVVYSTVPIYTSADKTSKVIRYAIPGEKVTIIASNPQWYGVRLYNGAVGFIEQRNLKTVKLFYDEQVTANYMNKRLDVELTELVDKFNITLKESVYTHKYQVAPKLTLVSAAKKGEMITLTMEYSAVDTRGSIIPSKQDNMLQEEMKSFVELLFMKMLTSMAESYMIVIRKPDFSPTGQVLNTRETYAELVLEHELVGVENINNRKTPRSENRLLSLVACNVGMDKLFKDFPN